MYCKKCGNSISSTAQFCDHCGQPVSKDVAAESRKKNIVGLVLGIFAGLMAAAAIMIAVNELRTVPSGSNKLLDHPNNNNISNNETPENSDIYDEGMYKVGTDIEAGEYFVYSVNSSCYFEVSSDSSGKLTSIITNDNTETFAFVTVASGQYLKINGGRFAKADKASVPGADAKGNYSAGMYRVGIDIPAGEYKVANQSDLMCYVEVSSDSSGSLFSIVSNDLVETFTYISVSEGQYLTVTNGQFAPTK